MILDVLGLEVVFPYDYIYPEQYQYMCDLKRAIDRNGQCLLEMPSGTGKTVSLLSLIVAYIIDNRMSFESGGSSRRRRLIYCSRTVPEIDKALEELKRLMEYRQSQGFDKELDFLALGLTSRKNLCINPTVAAERFGKAVDARCRGLTASWVREKATNTASTSNHEAAPSLCKFFEALETPALNDIEDIGNTSSLQVAKSALGSGVYTFDQLKQLGRSKGMCPYFLARRALSFCDVVIYSFHYLLDPKIADLISNQLGQSAIVVFDEAHNIDNVCIESMSVDLTRPVLESSSRCVQKLADRISEAKEKDSDKLRSEYEKLVEGLRKVSKSRDNNEILGNPVIPENILQEAVPGNIRKAEHFIAFLRRFIEYLKTRLKVLHVVAETPASFLQHLKEVTYIEKKPLQFCAERLSLLVRTLEITDIDEFASLNKVAVFGTLVSTYAEGFMLIFEPFESDTSTIPKPVFHLTCMDASLAIKPVFKQFSTVIITSGTLSPLSMYPQMLNFVPHISKSYPMTLTRACFCPLVISRGADQVAVSSQFEVRNDPAVVRNFGQILIDVSRTVPDGVVCFFPSYLYMESIVSMWNDMGLLNSVWKHKLIFVETPDAAETSIALENYRAACDTGRGAVLLSVARGKVSEGIDFSHHYGRAVIMFGVPYQYTESRILKARLEYLREKYHIRENDFLTFDALRHAAQCVGRVLRGKSDYGLMIFADKRYSRTDKRSKLPQWITAGFNDATTNLSTDLAMHISKRFLRTMAVPLDAQSQLGVSLWTASDVAKFSRSHKEFLFDPNEGMAESKLAIGQ